MVTNFNIAPLYEAANVTLAYVGETDKAEAVKLLGASFFFVFTYVNTRLTLARSALCHPDLHYPVMGVGTVINAVAVLVGGGIGALAGAKLPQGMRSTAMQAVGIVTLLAVVANFLVFDRMSTQIVSTLTWEAVQ